VAGGGEKPDLSQIQLTNFFLMTKAKRIIVELIFWWFAMALFSFLNDYRHPIIIMELPLTVRLYGAVQGISHIIGAFIITILSLLLQQILRRVK
jgi:hypothetical protein